MPWFGHLLDVGRLVVAEEGGTVIGFAGLLDLGSCVALSDLFVRPDRQSHGVGAALLDEVLPGGRPQRHDGLRRPPRPRLVRPARDATALAGLLPVGHRRAGAARARGRRSPYGSWPSTSTTGRCRAMSRTTARSAPDRWPSTGRACGWARRWSSTAARSASSTPTPPRCWRRPSTTRTTPRPSCWPSSPTSSTRAPPASWSRCQDRTARWPRCSSGASPSPTWTRPARARTGCWPTRPATRCTASRAWRPRRRAAGRAQRRAG